MQSRLAGDFVLALSSDVLGKVLGYVVLAALARALTQADMGELFFAIAFVSILASLTEMGTHRVLVRRVAQDRTNATGHLSEVLSVRLPAIGVAYGLLIVIAFGVMPERAHILLLTGVFVLIGDLYYSFGSLFLGLRRVGYRFVTGLLDPLLLVPMILIAVRLGWELPAIVGCYIAAKVISVLATALVARVRFGSFGIVRERGRLTSVVRESFPFFVLGFLGLVFLKVDTLMLLFFRSAEEVARYEAAYKFLEVSRFAVRAAAWVFFPLCAQMVARQDWAGLSTLTKRLLAGAAFGGLVVSVAVIPLAPFLVPLVWGDAYDTSIPVLQILFLGTPFLYLSFVGIFVAQALHRERAVVWMLVLAVVGNVLLNWAVIPRWGAPGAAWTTTLGECLLAASLSWLVLRRPGASLGVTPGRGRPDPEAAA
jgi:O-antigen/teichoic acid export membrane protein